MSLSPAAIASLRRARAQLVEARDELERVRLDRAVSDACRERASSAESLAGNALTETRRLLRVMEGE